MSEALERLYNPDLLILSADNEPGFEFNGEVMDRAARWLHGRGEFTPGMLSEQPAKELIDETFRVISSGVSSSITQHVPLQLTHALENNAFIFSGFKAYHTLNELGLKLTDDKGAIKPFETFTKDVQAVNGKYNVNYLYAEYNHAVHSSQMAGKWQEFEQSADRYDLQYRTAADDKVRASHAALHMTTLPASDPFWSMYLPPNSWNCRCNVVQVRKDKYQTSDSRQAIEAGNAATAGDKLQIFRFNPGKTMEIFPPKHPYYKAPGEVEKEVKKLAEERQAITTKEQLFDEIRRIDEQKKWFEHGVDKLLEDTNKNRNGATDLRGNIWLSSDRLKNSITGMDKLRKGGNVSFDEADALATLWHEITHNRNKIGMVQLTKDERWKMELANELVARNTLPEFYQASGSKMQYAEFMKDRQSTGYNRYVRNYCTIIEKTGANYDGVLKDVEQHLFNEKYDMQEKGLVDALMNNGAKKLNGNKLNRIEIKKMIRGCRNWGEKDFYEFAVQSLIE